MDRVLVPAIGLPDTLGLMKEGEVNPNLQDYLVNNYKEALKGRRHKSQ